MRQQEATRQAGAKSAAIAPGGTEAPRIPGVALVTKATAWRTQSSLAALVATTTLHLERMCMWALVGIGLGAISTNAALSMRMGMRSLTRHYPRSNPKASIRGS